MKLPLIKHSSKIPTMTRDSSEKIFAYHNVFQAIKANVLLINKGKAKNTGKKKKLKQYFTAWARQNDQF